VSTLGKVNMVLEIYLTDENMAVRVKSVVIVVPTRSSTMFAGIRKTNHVMKIRKRLGK